MEWMISMWVYSKLVKSRYLPLLIIFLAAGVLALILLPFYRNGGMILGGEGSYYTDFLLILQNYGFNWANYGTGIFATTLTYFFHLFLLQGFVKDERIINFVMIYLIYFLPFLVIYLLSLELKLKPWVSLLIAVFYIANPFSSKFLALINQLNVLALYILPSFFYLILRFYNKSFKLFFFFGLNSLLFSFTNANPPLMVLYQITLLLFVFFVSLYKEQKINLRSMIKNYTVIISSFFLFNIWWIINWFYIIFDAHQIYSKEFAISWLRGSREFIPALWRTLNLTSLLEYPPNPTYDYFNLHYSRDYASALLSIPILIIVYFLFRTNFTKKHHAVLGLTLVIVGFLSTGVKGIFGEVYEFMVMNLPYFSIFKSAAEKWGILFIFLLTLSLIFIFKELKRDKFYFPIIILFSLYVGYAAIPFTTGNFLPDYLHSDQVSGSKKFFYKSEYQDLRRQLNSDSIDYRVLSLPGSLNYQVALRIDGQRFYTGNDPILNNTNKAFLTPYNGNFQQRFGVLFDSISNPNYLNFLGLFNIKKIVINKDVYPWFGFREKESFPEIKAELDKNLNSSQNKVIDIYDTGDYYLPKFYVPDKIYYSPASNQDNLPEIVGVGNFSRRSALFIDPNVNTSKRGNIENSLVSDNSSETLVIGVTQRLIDKSSLPAGSKEINTESFLFPYARWKPGTFIYPFIQAREENTKAQFVGNPELLAEQNLFYAAKRIFEVQKWDRELSDSQFLGILNRYESELTEAIEHLKEAESQERDTFPLVLKIETSLAAYRHRLLSILIGDNFNERLQLAKSASDRIETKLNSIIEKNYPPTKYKFKISQDGEYEILSERAKTPFDWKLERTAKNMDERFVASVSSVRNDQNWLSFGKQHFKAGEEFLTFLRTTPSNLLDLKWEKVEGKITFDEGIKLLGRLDQLEVYQELKKWEPEAMYKLSFDYKTDRGQIRVTLLEEEKERRVNFDRVNLENLDKKNQNLSKTAVLLNSTVESDDQWGKFAVVIESGKNAKAARLFISGKMDRGQLGSAEIRNARLEIVADPKVVLRKMSSKQLDPPKITFNKVNVSKYVVDIEGANNPYFLVFSESFHRGWKTYIDKTQNSKLKTQNYKEGIVASYFDGQISERAVQNVFLGKNTFETWGKQSSPEDRHILMNGYANSWYITPEDAGGRKDYQIIVEYWPQRLFYIGAFITTLTIIITLFLGSMKLIKILVGK